MTLAGGHSRNRHSNAANLLKSRGPESAWRSLLSTRHEQMEQVYWYCLAYAAKLHGILVHAACLIANPVEAGAVRYAKDWPGAHTLPAHVGTRVIRVKPPTHYFDPNNPEWPKTF